MTIKWLHGAAGAGWSLLLAADLGAGTVYRPGRATPPTPGREFRGAWVATVNNIDWPSQPGLPVAQQKAELLALLDRAAQLRLNAIVFQVRTACDAFYASDLEPWSEYLTGLMGRAPEPAYDPLGFAVQEAHRRGLELHAWFNPFRARHSSGRSAVAASHVSRTQPQLVRTYGSQLWLDPGERAVHDYTLGVILDVVRRYDIDGVHLDDYFYPYAEKDAAGRDLAFPDEAPWQRYVKSGGRLARGDWRRDNVNTFVQRLYQGVKAAKPWVKVGISPFGIWRPGFPASVRGLDAYEQLFADSRRWLASGWLDYCSPQLYWPINAPAQSYPALLQWWSEQNTHHRHLWPGNSVYRAAVQPGELLAQVRATRRTSGATGNLFWSMKTLQNNKNNVASDLARLAYAQPVLVPPSTWLDAQPPAKPTLSLAQTERSWNIAWQASGQEAVWLWVLQRQAKSGWSLEILPGAESSRRLPAGGVLPLAVAIRAVDRCGNMSSATVLERSDTSAPPKRGP
jgi:uncharacterized lipoprotein YddW (UPF0748 family)